MFIKYLSLKDFETVKEISKKYRLPKFSKPAHFFSKNFSF